MSDDPLRDAIEDAFVVERTGWAGERVRRVTERLQLGVPEAQRLETLVVWMDEHNAFTAQDGRCTSAGGCSSGYPTTPPRRS